MRQQISPGAMHTKFRSTVLLRQQPAECLLLPDMFDP